MNLPAELTQAIVKAAGKELAAVMRDEIKGSQLLTLQQAADLLGVSKQTARTLVGEIIDLGEHSPRLELSRVKAIIQKRRVAV